MSQKKELSIIIPHYNTPESLETLLKSIGIKEGVEIIIIDDRSTLNLDKYSHVKNKYNTDNIIFLENNRRNKGAGTARNIGLSKATGKWILFADSDDYFTNNWYDKVSKFFESDYDIVYFTPTCTNINEKNNRANYYINKIKKFINKADNSDFILRYTFSPPWSKLIRKDLIISNNIYFDEVLYSNDVCFSTKIGYYAKKITAVSEAFYCITETNNKSLTKNLSEKAIYIRCLVCCNQFKFLKEKLKTNFFLIEPYIRLKQAMKNRFKITTILRIIKTFHKAGIPYIYLTPLNKYYIKKLFY